MLRFIVVLGVCVAGSIVVVQLLYADQFWNAATVGMLALSLMCFAHKAME